MRIAVPRETAPGEHRVALVPESAAKLAKAGCVIVVERGAGQAAGFTDAAYHTAGVTLVADFAAACAGNRSRARLTASRRTRASAPSRAARSSASRRQRNQ